MSPCRAPLVVCAAPDRDSLQALKRAAVGAEWGLSSGATSVDEALAQLEDHHALVLVVHVPVPGLVGEARKRFPALRIVCVGAPGEDGADVVVRSLDEVRPAVMGPSPAAPSPERRAGPAFGPSHQRLRN
jgi:hypothetical protein